MSLKRGKYSKTEEQFVVDNVHNMTVTEIAGELGRGTASVESLIKKKKLKTVVTKEDEDEVQRLIGLLHQSTHWEKLKVALTKDEMKLFQTDWLEMIHQFGEDVWYTEEKYIVDWIILDLRKYRTLKLEKDALQQIEDLEKNVAREYSLDSEERDTAALVGYERELAIQKSALTQHGTAITKILEKIEKISDKLKANREERRDIKANEDTFWGYIQMLEDEKFRRNESRQAQLMKKAQDAQREKLYEYHEYMDDEVDIPLLTPEIVLRNKEEEKYERKAEDVSET